MRGGVGQSMNSNLHGGDTGNCSSEIGSRAWHVGCNTVPLFVGKTYWPDPLFQCFRPLCFPH